MSSDSDKPNEPAKAEKTQAPYQGGDQWKIWAIAFSVFALAMLLAL